MTLDAQHDVVAGAILTASGFRDSLKDCHSADDVEDVLSTYFQDNGLGNFDSELVASVWTFISVPGILPQLKDCITLFCRQWPCR